MSSSSESRSGAPMSSATLHEALADIKEQIRQIEANLAEDPEGSCSAVIIDLPYARALIAEINRVRGERSETKPSDIALSAIDSEPELPGDMPDEMWEAIRNDRDAIINAMRIAVRQTKEGIRERYLAAFSQR